MCYGQTLVRRKRAGVLADPGSHGMQSAFSIASFEAVCQLYTQFLATVLPDLRCCPGCHRLREIQGARYRALQWATDQIDFILLTRLRCRHCHTVETIFPPWILPYELAALWMLEAAVTAVAVDGQSLQHTATQGHWTLDWMRAHVRPWLQVSVEFRTIVAQWSHAAGVADLVDADWVPPDNARVADWAWLCVAWHRLMLLYLDAGSASLLSGWIVWRTLAPDRLPAAPIPPRTHLGRRVRQPPPSPP